jgi:eukaryotic-like serine/threonine-protein kinase
MEQAHPVAIGKYEILSVIGRGGMGVVYRAQDRLMGRQVAIKTVTEVLSSDAGMLKRFYGEAEKMGMLKHPNIITVYDLGEQDGFPYIVMEYVEGDPLDRIIQSDKPVSLIFKLRIIEQVCAALGYAHQNDVIHRDVKPANVIVRPDGVAKLLDFGIARQENRNVERGLTEPGGVIGTVPYMAPERLRGAPLDGRSDVFATGVLLFQFLTGRLPFTGTEYVLVNQLLNEKHPPLSEFLQDYPEPLDGILDRSLAKDPADRYQTADEMAADLYSVIDGLKQNYSAHLMLQAETLGAAADYVGARDSLAQLLKLDGKNIQARKMLAELNLRLTRQACAEQAKDKCRQAEDALLDKNFDQAVRLLEEAVKLVPEDAAVTTQLEAARAKKQTNDQILGYLRQADAAKRSGDYTGARAIVEKAIQLDTGNSRLRAAYNSLIRQSEEAAQQARIKAMVDAAKNALNQRDYAGVLAIVKQAEQLDPSSVELQDLTRVANEGIFQEQRRKLFAEIEEQLAASITHEETERVAAQIREALEKTPSDPTLLRYQAQIDRRLREHETKRLVEDTVKHCRAILEAAPLEALEAVRKALRDVPGDDRLTALEATIQDRIARLSAEETRNAILLRARDALNQRRFADAVRVLEQCQGPIRTPEIDQLLEYARQESRQEDQRQLVARAYADAQTLLREEKYPEVVALLTPVLQAENEPRLRNILEQAQRILDQRHAEHCSALAAVKPFADAGCHEQVVAAAEALPGGRNAHPEIHALQSTAQKTWMLEWTRLEALGHAYATLVSADSDSIALVANDPTSSPLLGEMFRMFSARRTTIVDQILAAQVERVQAARAAGTIIDPAAELAPGRKLLPFASDEAGAAWSHLADQSSGGRKVDGFLARLGRKRA